MSGPVARLVAGEASEDDWRALEASTPDEREAAAAALKDELDRRVRASPSDAGPLVEALARLARGTPSIEPLALRGRAMVAHVLGRAGEAIEAYEGSLRAYEARGQELDAARVRRSLVDVLELAGRHDEAIACAGHAREVFERLGERTLLAQLDVNLGNVHYRAGRLREARAHYGAARAVFVDRRDARSAAFAEFSLANLELADGRPDEAERRFRAARAPWEAAGMHALVADVDQRLADLVARRGLFEDAIAGLERARAGYGAGARAAGVPECDLGLADLFARLGGWRDSVARARRAVEGFASLDRPLELARARLALAVALRRTGRPAEALDELLAAERALEDHDDVGHRTVVELERCRLARESGRFDVALPRLRRAVEELAGRSDLATAGLATLELARTELAASHAREALDVLAGWRGRGREAHVDVLLEAEFSWTRAQALRALGDDDAALAAMDEAFERVDRSFVELPGVDVRVAFLQDRQAIATTYARSLVELDPPAVERAFEVLERTRQRGSLGVRVAADGPSDELRAARTRLEWLLASRLERDLDPGRGPVDGGFDARLEEAREEVLRLAGREGAEGASDLAPTPAALASEEVYVGYLEHEGRCSAFVAERGGVEHVELAVDAGELEDARRWFELGRRRHLAGRAARHAGETLELLARFGDWFLAPLLPRLAGRRVTLAPGARLGALPFHAFLVDGAPVVERFVPVLSPGLRALLAGRRRPRSGSGEVLLFADEGVGPAVGLEVAAVERAHGDRVRRVAASRASELLAHPVEARILHVAGHGTADARDPRLGGLLLGGRFLSALELRGLELQVDLVLLTGCETGRTLAAGGEEVAGLHASFLTAGARTVLGSPWPVQDEVAGAFAAAFHGALAEGHDLQGAFGAAQAAVRIRWPDPFAWGSFLLAGDPAAL